MLNLNATILDRIVQSSLSKAAAHPRWITAIERAVVELETNPWIERLDGHLLIASPSGDVHSANGQCSCKAYAFHRPCWHRAAARIVRLHDEAISSFRPRMTTAERQKATAEMSELFS